MKVGITFGGYCPMHTGHLDLIMRAKKENDLCYVIVCGYDNEPRADEIGLTLKRRYSLVKQMFKDDEQIKVFMVNDTELGIDESMSESNWDIWLRCATITDLKYNSWGNLSYYVKIDNDKDISIDYPTDLLLPYDNKIKGFIEQERVDELSIKPPKFKVGDKITNGEVTLTILTLSLDRYVVEDTFRKCGTLYFNSQDEWKIVEEETKPEYEDEKNGEAKPKYEDEVNGEFHSTTKYLVRPSGYQFVDENGNVINAQKIVLEKKPSKTEDIIKWLRECDMTKYIGVLYSGMCTITFDTEGLITDFLKTVEDDE